MKNENVQMQVFKNEEFGKVRIVVIDGKEYFYGVDIATSLGYERPSKAISDHCKGILKQDTIKNEGGYPEKLISEGDVYRLIIKSKLPSAQKFEQWVCDEVLPTIRKTGGFIANSDLMVNTYFGALDDSHKQLVKGLFENIEAQQKKITYLQNENDALSKDILEWADESVINALVRRYSANSSSNFGEAWIQFKKDLLYKYSINLNTRITNYLNETGKKTKPKTLSMLRDREELTKGVKTAIAMCRDKGIEIEDIIKKHLSENERIS